METQPSYVELGPHRDIFEVLALPTGKMQAMTRLLLVIGLIFALAMPVLAERPRPLAWAIDAVGRGNWDEAARIANRDGPIARDVIEWMRLRAGGGTYAQVMAFLDRRPDWPGETYLRRRSEAAVIAAGEDAVVSYFAEAPPQTPRGVLAHARALKAAGQVGEAQVSLVLAWRTMQMSSADQAAFLDAHATLLKPHHPARLDSMLWRGSGSDARRMFELVTKDQVTLAEARLGLINQDGNVDALITAVPDALRGDPGLAHARFEWRVRKGRWDAAKALLLDRSASLEALGRPEYWAKRRRALARDEMRDGEPALAYQLAAQHFLSEGSSYADLEWLSGYIALRYLEDPEIALEHFRNHEAAVRSPISLGRAGYWIGRAYEELEQTERALASYADAAQYQTAFYGLLAAERAGLPADPALAGEETFGDWRAAPLASNDLFEAGLLLQASAQLSLAERYWTHLAETLDRESLGQLGAAAIDLEQPHLAVMIGKRAARRGLTLHAPYYALHPLAEADLPMAPELSLAIARRESEFDPRVQSGAGARGLMQIMPRTGLEVARGLGVENHSTERLTSDPVYNARLGTQYLSELAARFDGNVVMIAAAYNAGPSRPSRWMELYGDPRRDRDIDIIDWIEHIPFRETRNYVMRVTESLPIYRARLGKPALPVPFSQELGGSTLLAFAPEGE